MIALDNSVWRWDCISSIFTYEIHDMILHIPNRRFNLYCRKSPSLYSTYEVLTKQPISNANNTKYPRLLASISRHPDLIPIIACVRRFQRCLTNLIHLQPNGFVLGYPWTSANELLKPVLPVAYVSDDV